MQKMIDVQFWVGDRVYHKCDSENKPGIVLEVIITPEGAMYRCSFGEEAADRFYALELSREKNYQIDEEDET